MKTDKELFQNGDIVEVLRGISNITLYSSFGHPKFIKSSDIFTIVDKDFGFVDAQYNFSEYGCLVLFKGQLYETRKYNLSQMIIKKL